MRFMWPPPMLPTGPGFGDVQPTLGRTEPGAECDGRRGYAGKPFAGEAFCRGGANLLGASVEVVKRNELHTFVVLPKRWVVERSFARLEKCCRLWKNCEGKLNTSLQMVILAFAVLILKRL